MFRWSLALVALLLQPVHFAVEATSAVEVLSQVPSGAHCHSSGLIGIVIVLLLHRTLFTIPFAVQCLPIQSIWNRTITDPLVPGESRTRSLAGGKERKSHRADSACVASAVRVRSPVESVEQSMAMLCGSLPTLRLLFVKFASRRRPASSERFSDEHSPQHGWNWSLDRLRQYRARIRRDSDPGPQHAGGGVLVTTTVEIARRSYLNTDLPPFHRPHTPDMNA
ncbi:hypothetical protein CORC01_13286 [Colletotrichum orchidophilum]|uniref:Secreted protein n=1 Tax=Colletotrichum orchidophilum TaxID=1209926 RepID=A0A1G4AQP4_9PEZI|nr:uncharacterized protein CORC01_13286 [Colletotrichum orchidophilum]OHE91421.1 hypothetical protein CORC01_13286 [Colletotrichum orchidophilum]